MSHEMSRGVHNELTKKNSGQVEGRREPLPAHEKPRGTAAQNLIQHAAGWAGDDLEEIIEIVSATRSRSRF